MKTKHTQGEWVAIKIDEGYAIKEKGLYEKGFSDRIAELYYYREIEANARLIAAAPELLKVLQHLTSLDDICYPTIIKEEALAAIKKATE